MAQLDKLLAHIAPRGGKSLLMEPNQQPQLELLAGGSLALLPNPVPTTMIDMLASEILPFQMKDQWLSQGKAVFDYDAGGQRYQITLNRGAQGTIISAEPAGQPAPPPPQRTQSIELDLSGGGGGQAAPPPPAPAPPPPPTAPIPVATASVSGPPRPKGDRTHPLAEKLFSALLERKGSDLHCSSLEVPMARVAGDIVEFDEFGILSSKSLLEMMETIATPEGWKQFTEKNDADFAYPFESGNCRLRVNYFMDRVGPGLVCRVIPNQIPTADQLGLTEHIKRTALLAKGLVLVTGPTGSGKSTTLAAIIDLANQKRRDHILTIEDPIEFVHPRKGCLINQREVGTHTESFKSGLRAALREDPDIVLVGEMRDLETISIALETAITGHLVYGTLHTSSAIGTIDRIVDQFPSDRQSQIRVMLADALKACMAQTLMKKIGGGRIAAVETMFVTPAIANLIREGKNFQIMSAMQTGKAYGQRLMDDLLIDYIKEKKVEPMEAYLKCPDKETFMQALKRANINFDPRAGGETEI
jgi:twitching motility protein PilT